MKSEITIRTNEKSVVVLDDTRSITVSDKNVIHIKGLTSLVGKEPATTHFLSADDLVKNTILRLTDEGVLLLTQALIIHSQKVLGAIIEI